jgi:endonuclease/exonuclease/phosphatase family metal-dependent hydrolase
VDRSYGGALESEDRLPGPSHKERDGLGRPSSNRDSLPDAKRRRAGSVLLGFVLISGLVFYLGDARRPMPAAVGSSLSGESRPATTVGRTIRIATFNIHGGKGSDHRLDLSRTASALRGFDLLLLNEVHGPYFWQAEGQTQRLGEATQRRWLFAPTEQRWWHHQFGNAVLSARELTRWQRIPLPSHGRAYRNAVLMTLPLGDRTLQMVGTHLDRNDPRDRDEQLRAVIGLFLSLAKPVVLLGDLNTTADEAPLAELLARDDVGDPLGEVLAGATPRRIDWVLTRGLKTIDAGTIDNGTSDHPLFWAELE